MSQDSPISALGVVSNSLVNQTTLTWIKRTICPYLSRGEDRKDEFQALLNDVHKVNEVSKFEETPLSSTESVMKQLTGMDPAPMEQWAEIITGTITKLNELTPDAHRGDVLTAIGLLSDRIHTAKSDIEARLTPRAIVF